MQPQLLNGSSACIYSLFVHMEHAAKVCFLLPADVKQHENISPAVRSGYNTIPPK